MADVLTSLLLKDSGWTSPYTTAAQGLARTPVSWSPKMKWYETLGTGLMKGLGTGVLQGMGQSQEDARMDRLTEALTGIVSASPEERIALAAETPELQKYMPVLALQEQQERKAASDRLEAAMLKHQMSILGKEADWGLKMKHQPALDAAKAQASARAKLAVLPEELRLQREAEAAALPPEAMASDSMRFINTKIPKNQRTTAIKELGFRDDLEQSQSKINELLDSAKQISTIDAMRPYSAGRAKLQTINGNLAGLVAQAIKGNPSVDEAKRQIDPFMIDALDTAERIEEKRKGLLDFLEVNKKSTPMLDRYGVGREKAKSRQKSKRLPGESIAEYMKRMSQLSGSTVN